MIEKLRTAFNQSFTKEKYEAYISALEALEPGALDFRNAETAIYIPKDFTKKMIDACEAITDVICDEKFEQLTARAVPSNVNIPNENKHTHFIAFDFGICENEKGELEPQLIEMQGFPTLFAYQAFQSEITRQYADVPDYMDSYLSGYTKETYLQLLKEIILGTHQSENVILLEIFPEKQKTRIDFFCTQKAIGINVVCVTNLIKEGKDLYYLNNGVKTKINRIYNRLIFDDLQQQIPEVQEKGNILFADLDVEWVPHPNWFYRISKYTLPLIHHPYVPETYFLNEIKELPQQLDNYVLKPLFSFAGQGVVIDIKQEDIDNVKDPENWILQKKVKYADVIKTPDEPAKAELRIFYFWKEGWARPIAVHNLARMSKGKMIGTRYNKDKEWVGGTIAYFEK
jgi:glutathionylspermidine synthase